VFLGVALVAGFVLAAALGTNEFGTGVVVVAVVIGAIAVYGKKVGIPS
jgi:hypothetical protein